MRVASRGAEFTAAVVGEVNLDIAVKIPADALADRTEDILVHGPMAICSAGTAVGFALAATQYFCQVHLFGRVGDDAIGDMILDQLTHPRLAVHVARDESRPSRVVVVLREGSAGTLGRRVMISRTDVANARLATEDLAALYDRELSIDVVLFDGYAHLYETSRATASRAAVHVAERGIPVAFDVVPHDVYRMWSLDDLLTIAAPATFVIAEVVTLLRFIGVDSEPQSVEEVQKRLPGIRDVFGDRILMLRFGTGRVDQSLMIWPDGSWRHRYTGYTHTSDAAGFGDRLTAEELVEALRHLKNE